MPERAGHNIENPRTCCSTEMSFQPHAPSCRVLLDARAAVAAAQEQILHDLKHRRTVVLPPDPVPVPDAVHRVLAWCDAQDVFSKGPSPTTVAVRKCIYGDA